MFSIGIFYTDMDIFWFFLLFYAPSVLLAVHLCMPSKKHNSMCGRVMGTLCVFGFIVTVIMLNQGGFNFALVTGIASVAGAIASVIGFNVRKYLDGKTYRKSLSLLLILIHFVARSLFWLWRMML